VHIINSETGENVQNAGVNLRSGHSSTGTVTQTAITDANGIAVFNNNEYGYYTAETN